MTRVFHNPIVELRVARQLHSCIALNVADAHKLHVDLVSLLGLCNIEGLGSNEKPECYV